MNDKPKKPCILCKVCKIKTGEIREEKAQEEVFIAENDRSLVVVDQNPRSKAHMMAIPKKHSPTLEDLELEDWNSFLPLMKETIRRIDKVYQPVGL